MAVRVVTAEQAAARDAAAIATGVTSAVLMRRAGVGAARLILERSAPASGQVALVCCGPGNNGGDGWIVADALAAGGMRVHVLEAGEARSRDAALARQAAFSQVAPYPPRDRPSLIVDALLGTGSRGPLRGPVAHAAEIVTAAREGGANVVALDLPTGVDATTGETVPGAVHADRTISFGTIKRGHLVARSHCGEIVVLDIGLDAGGELGDGAPLLVDERWVEPNLPHLPAEAHKGTRRRLLIVGGDRGMAGAVALAARGALRSGVGMVRLWAHPASCGALQALVPEATTAEWAPDPAADAPLEWPHAVLIGPGLGSGEGARDRVRRWLTAWEGPVVLDADALNAFAGDEATLGSLLDGRPAVVTPHPLEFARLIGVDLDTVLAERFEIGARLARALHAVVLLKGVPSIITAPDGESFVSASGTPVLGTAGSGDVLAGMVATLLAQGGDPLAAAACGAWVHGRAGEVANAGRTVRGVTLEDVLAALGVAWPVARTTGRSVREAGGAGARAGDGVKGVSGAAHAGGEWAGHVLLQLPRVGDG